MEPKLPDLPKPAVRCGDYAGPPGEGADENYFDADQLRSYGLQCYRMGVEAERERCATLCEGMWEIDGSHTASQFAAAIRGTDTETRND